LRVKALVDEGEEEEEDARKWRLDKAAD